MGNSLQGADTSAASVASAASFSKKAKNNRGRWKKRLRRGIPLKAKKMPADAADRPSDDYESAANRHKNGLSAAPENAGRPAADREGMPADRANPGGRYESFSRGVQEYYWRQRDAGCSHYDALGRAIDYEELCKEEVRSWFDSAHAFQRDDGKGYRRVTGENVDEYLEELKNEE
jgi:hypothetical protein